MPWLRKLVEGTALVAAAYIVTFLILLVVQP